MIPYLLHQDAKSLIEIAQRSPDPGLSVEPEGLALIANGLFSASSASFLFPEYANNRA